ncbi:DUF3772 domain-containing protein [Limibaculum sp. FT325]|uniref:mechanosensitive ion channel family protein n=1 Tax=Thermohalobaculum sediminis TaxID=2939436 RepID=UPI0020BE1BBF|nr:DUF3772 domain-containing protein [Limibaculum sediminis]MCL5777429.1 DUF3772 domain-containing protein [Limibaculum sediminis]
MRASILGALIGAFLALALAGPLHAQRPEKEPEPPRVLLEQWEQRAEAVAREIDDAELDFERIDKLRGQLSAEIGRMGELAARLETELAPLLRQREALGPAPAEGASEAPDVAKERARLNAAIEELEGAKRRTQQASARAAAQIDRLLAQRRQIFSEALLNRGPSVLEPQTLATAVSAVGRGVGVLFAESRERIAEQGLKGGEGLAVRIITPLMVIVAAFFGFRRVRDVLIGGLSRRISPNVTASRRLAIAAGLTATRLFLPILTLAVVFLAAAASGLLGVKGLGILMALGIATSLAVGAYALGSAYFSPHAPELRISALGDRDATRAHRWLIALAAIYSVDWILVVEGKSIGVGIELLTVYNTTLQILGGVALWNLVGIIHRRDGGDTREGAEGGHDFDDGGAEAEDTDAVLVPILLRLAGIVMRAVAVLAPSLALGGYFAASRFVFHPPIASFALIGFFVLLYSVVREIVEGIFAPSAAATSTQRRLRLIPVAVGFLLTVLAIPLLAMIWGANTVDLVTIWRQIGEGFMVGDLRLSPVEFLSFCIVFSIGFLLTRLLQGVLRHSVLPLTALDTGARAAIIAGVGYIGILIAALVAISTAGLDLSNLAIVAGALSVGIGFGLQNIVNNFVSGLILLIERPIKAGDWVEIPSGMGYVKQINVRSTEIETFDRSSLIVPNSELISSTVTNYTHNNLQGRMIAKVGVAYGSDTRKVEAILLEIARAHPMVLRRPAPWINFAGFGDSALNFEIRAILRDVNWVVNVRSDLNHEIARRFAAEGIEIPFPQRDLHLRNPAAISAALAPQAAPPAPRRRKGAAQGDAPPHPASDDASGGDTDAGDGR